MKLFDRQNRLWECPQVPSINTLRPRSPLFSFGTEDEARQAGYDPFDCPNIVSLNGEWSFKHFENPDQVDEALLEDNVPTAAWDKIEVPGNWTRQGYDFPHYVNVQMPFGDTPPLVPKDRNPAGLYRRTFKLRPKAQRVVLHFGGIESCGFIYVNGTGVGMIKDSRTACEFDISGVVRPGENTLAVLVLRYCDGSFLEDQDHWRMAGIHRDVYLEYTPNAHITDVFARTSLDEDLTTGVLDLRVDAAFSGSHEIPSDWHFAVQLYDGKKALLRKPDLLGFYDVNAQHAFDNHFLPLAQKQYRFEKIKPWSAETPHLYRITVTLLDGQGQAIQSVGHDIGFRSVKLEDGCVKINGQPVKFFGVNRHDFNEYTGKRVTMADMEADVKLMKQFNINAIRTCHYPNDERLVALCNRYGLYVISECNIETHAYCDHLTDDPLWLTPMLERMKRMVLIYKNNPCIHMWSMGNESGTGENFAALSCWTHKFDPSRLVHYAELVQHYPDEETWFSIPNRNVDLVDVVSPMYPSFDKVDKWINEMMPVEKRPFIMCEYSHGMGNSHGALSEYFKRFRAHTRMQGGYIWDWIDQGLHEVDAGGRKFWAYGGDYGDTPNDYNFIGNGLVAPDHTPHPACYEHRYLAQPFAIRAQALPRQLFDLTNLNYFTTLEEYDFIWEVECNGTVVASGRIDSKAVAAIGPQQTGTVSIEWMKELPAIQPDAEYFLNIVAIYRHDTLWAAEGDILGHEQFEVTSALPVPFALPPAPAASLLTAEIKGRSYICGQTQIELDSEGMPQKWIIGQTPLLDCPITELFMRGQIDNDAIRNDMNCPWRDNVPWIVKWDLFNLKRKAVGKAALATADGCLRARSRVDYTAANGAKIGVERDVLCRPDGTIEINMLFNVPQELNDMPRLGFTAVLPEGFEELTWFGRGPHECYVDRQAGAMVGLYHQKVDEQYFPYLMPQECGNHTGVRRVTVSNGKAAITVETRGACFEMSALHFTPEDFMEAYHINELNPRPQTMLNIQVMQRGLGTGSCGESTLDKYRVRAGQYAMSVRLSAQSLATAAKKSARAKK